MGFIWPGVIVKINDRNEYDLRSEKKHKKRSTQKGTKGKRIINDYSSETSKFLKRYAQLYPDNKVLSEIIGSDLSEFQNCEKRRKINNNEETSKQKPKGKEDIVDNYDLQEIDNRTPISFTVKKFTNLPLEILTKIMILSDNFESLILTNRLLHDIIENQKNYLMFENIKHCYLHIFDLANNRKTSFNYGISRRRVTNEDGHDHIANALITKLDRHRRANMRTRKVKNGNNKDSIHMTSLISNSGSEEEEDDDDEEVEASDTESDSDSESDSESDSDIQSESSTVISISEEDGRIHPLHTSPYRAIVLDEIVFRRKHFMNFKILDALSVDLILSSSDIEKLKSFALKFKTVHNLTKTQFLKDFKEKNKPLIQFPFIEDYHRRQIKVKDKMKIIGKIINMDSIFMQKIENVLEYIISHDHKQIISLSVYQKLIDQNLNKPIVPQTGTQGESGADQQQEVQNTQDETTTDDNNNNNITTVTTDPDATTNDNQNEIAPNRITYLKSTEPLVNAIKRHNWDLVELLINYYDKNILSNDDSLWEFIVESKNWKYIQKLESVGINPSSEVLSILARLQL